VSGLSRRSVVHCDRIDVPLILCRSSMLCGYVLSLVFEFVSMVLGLVLVHGKDDDDGVSIGS